MISTDFCHKRLPAIVKLVNYLFKPPYINKDHPIYNDYNLYIGKTFSQKEVCSFFFIAKLHYIYID